MKQLTLSWALALCAFAMNTYIPLNATVKSVESCDEFGRELQGNRLVVAYFYTKDHNSRDANLVETMREIENFERHTSRVVDFIKIDAARHDLTSLTQQFKITHTPTIMLLKDRVEVARVNGTNPDGTLRKLAEITHDIQSALDGNFASTIKTLEEDRLRAVKIAYYSEPRVNVGWNLGWGWPYWGGMWYPYAGWGWSCW